MRARPVRKFLKKFEWKNAKAGLLKIKSWAVRFTQKGIS